MYFIKVMSDSRPKDPGQTGSFKKCASKNHSSGLTVFDASIRPNPLGPPSVVYVSIESIILMAAAGKLADPACVPPGSSGVRGATSNKKVGLISN